MTAYQKEIWFTVIIASLFLLSGHMGFIFSIFPTESYFMGFPVKYIVPIIVGWFGVFLLTIIAGYLGNHIDDEINKENESIETNIE